MRERGDATQKMERSGQTRSVVLAAMWYGAVIAAVLALMAALSNAPRAAMHAAAGAGDGVTHLRVTNEVILPT